MKPNDSILLDLLKNNDVTFFIPPYQRNYEWTEEQCSVFLDDVIKTMKANARQEESEHFFGTITYFAVESKFGQPNKLVLIDGQQRITTTMLFLMSFRDIIGRDSQDGRFIENKFLKNENISDESEFKIKLKQVETDWKTYKKLITCEPLSDIEKNSAVFRNYNYFYNKLSNYSDEFTLIDLIQLGLSKFRVITIELEPFKNKWENPQEIFESMNSLGKPLALADLVRNYLLLGQTADAQETLYNDYWLKIEKNIPGQVSNFIRDFMQAQECRSFLKATDKNCKELYSLFKQIFPLNDVPELLEDLRYSSNIYSYVIGNQSTSNCDIDKILKDIRYIGVTTSYSFLMTILKAWKKNQLSGDDTIEILDAFRIYCLRRRPLGITTAENKVFPTLSSYIQDLVRAEDKRLAMFGILSNLETNLRLPNDAEVSRSLSMMNFNSFRYNKFYLALVEEKISGVRPDLSDTNLQIEHIMPTVLTEQWICELGDNYSDIHLKKMDTIGNITIILHKSELGSMNFTEKKKIYESDDNFLVSKIAICNKDTWNADAIDERTSKLIRFLLESVLPIPNQMRNANNYKIKGNRLSFKELNLLGFNIYFYDDQSIVARVVGDREVEFEGKIWHLSPLTREIQTRRGKVTQSGAYQGANYWAFDGVKLIDLM